QSGELERFAAFTYELRINASCPDKAAAARFDELPHLPRVLHMRLLPGLALMRRVGILLEPKKVQHHHRLVLWPGHELLELFRRRHSCQSSVSSLRRRGVLRE